MPGEVAGALMLLWTAARRGHRRRAVIFAAVSGVLTWSVGTALASIGDEGRLLPEVSVVDMNGKPQALARHDGKPLAVNLRASWSGPCRREIPVLAQAHRQYSGVDITFVNQGESPDTVGDFLAREAISLQNLVLDPSLAVARAVGGRALPTTLFYDDTGKLLAVHQGPFSAATFQNALETLYPKAVAGQS